MGNEYIDLGVAELKPSIEPNVIEYDERTKPTRKIVRYTIGTPGENNGKKETSSPTAPDMPM